MPLQKRDKGIVWLDDDYFLLTDFDTLCNSFTYTHFLFILYTIYSSVKGVFLTKASYLGPIDVILCSAEQVALFLQKKEDLNKNKAYYRVCNLILLDSKI